MSIMKQQKYSPRRKFNDNEAYNDPKFRMLFPPKTEEQMYQESLESLEYGHFVDYRESLRRFREEYGL